MRADGLGRTYNAATTSAAGGSRETFVTRRRFPVLIGARGSGRRHAAPTVIPRRGNDHQRRIQYIYRNRSRVNEIFI